MPWIKHALSNDRHRGAPFLYTLSFPSSFLSFYDIFIFPSLSPGFNPSLMERVPLLEFEAILVLILLVSNHTFFDKNHCCLANFQKVESRSLSLSLSRISWYIQSRGKCKRYVWEADGTRFVSIYATLSVLVSRRLESSFAFSWGREGNARNALYEWKERKKEEERFGSISLW